MTSTADMPLYPSEKQIALAVLGPERAKDWKHIAKFLEDKAGLPPIDDHMGGRFWPAVQAFFYIRHGMHLLSPVAGIDPQPRPRIKVAPYPGSDMRVAHGELSAPAVVKKGKRERP